MDERLDALRAWLKGLLTDVPFQVEPASADASFRRYFRVTTQEHSLIAMDAPPTQEDSRPFVDVAGLLTGAGLNAPQVVASDLERGFLLLTDLGSDLYLPALLRGQRMRPLYQAAIDALVQMQSRIDPAPLPPYDRAFLLKEMRLFPDWLLTRHLGLDVDRDALEEVFEALAGSAVEQARVFVHRDFHSRNLMLSAGGDPGILDFQDAMNGPLSYDLVSLLKDCYVKCPDALRRELVGYYLAKARAAKIAVPDDERFRADFDLMGVQRHLKASGIFARLMHRDGKAGYLADVPRTLSYIVDCAGAYPQLGFLADLIEARVLPALAERAG